MNRYLFPLLIGILFVLLFISNDFFLEDPKQVAKNIHRCIEITKISNTKLPDHVIAKFCNDSRYYWSLK